MPWKWLIVFCLALVTAACESPVTPRVSLPTGAAVDPSIRIPVGQSAHVAVGLNDPIQTPDPLGLEGWPDYRSRVVHVMASEPMTLIVRVVSDTETEARIAAWRVLNDATCCTWKWQSIHQVMITIPSPADLAVELIIPVNGPAETFTVSTWRVEP